MRCHRSAVVLQRLGKKGVLALLCDSTNAETPGFYPCQRELLAMTFEYAFLTTTQKSRIIIATFASNVDRVQQIINTAYKFGRKVSR